MKKKIKNRAAGVAFALLLFGVTGCGKLQARDQLNKGMQAYKNGNYEQAIEHFKNAVGLDNKLRVAKLYLATAYAQQYVPGVDTPENNSDAERAIEGYKTVLAEDPKNLRSLKGIADLYTNMKKFDDAREYYKRAIEADPNDVENYYFAGVVDWTAVYKDISDRKAKIGLGMAEQLTTRQICDEIKATDGPRIEDGMKMLQTALEKKPNYDEARNYMNLLAQRKADMECSDPQASHNDQPKKPSS